MTEQEAIEKIEYMNRLYDLAEVIEDEAADIREELKGYVLPNKSAKAGRYTIQSYEGSFPALSVLQVQMQFPEAFAACHFTRKSWRFSIMDNETKTAYAVTPANRRRNKKSAERSTTR